MMGSFIPLAIITRANIVLNVFGYFWPVEVAVYHLEGLIQTHMTSNHYYTVQNNVWNQLMGVFVGCVNAIELSLTNS